MLCWCGSERTTGATPVTDEWRLNLNTFAKLQIPKSEVKVSQHRQLCIVQLGGILWQIRVICLKSALEIPSHWNVSEWKTGNYKRTGGVNPTASKSETLDFKWPLLHFCNMFNKLNLKKSFRNQSFPYRLLWRAWNEKLGGMKTARGWKSTVGAQMTKYAHGHISSLLQVSLLWALQICCALSRQ